MCQTFILELHSLYTPFSFAPGASFVCLFVCLCVGLTIIKCFPKHVSKLMWRHLGNDVVSVAAICVTAICAAAQLIFLFGRTRLAV